MGIFFLIAPFPDLCLLVLFSNIPGTKRAVQAQNMGCLEVRNFGFRKKRNYKVADQLCSYCKADLRLYFRICKMFFFSHDAAQMRHVSLMSQ